MAENKENDIDVVFRVIDSAINIKVTRKRSTDVIRNSILFQANAHLHNRLGPGAQARIRASRLIGFDPPVGPETRFCDFTAEDKSITVYVLAELDTPSLMARVRALEAEKENQVLGVSGNSSKLPQHATSIHINPLPSSSAPQPTNADMFDMLKALQLRLDGAEAQRKKDLEQAEAQRKMDAEKAEAKRTKDLEQVEARRKKDLEQAEAQRKTDAEKAEAKQTKDLEQAEARRKKDAEKAEAQRKKDAEKAEAQRKKDQADAREQSRKLLVNIDELEYKIKRLEQQATDRDLERKQKDEATQRYIESLAGDIEATTDFLAVGDEAGLDRIKRRNLLDRAQALLAAHLGLADNNSYSASMCFRESLGPLSSSDERQKRLFDVLREKRDELPRETVSLITKPAALGLLAERFSKVRLHGDQVAHGYRPRSWYEGAVTRSVDKAALMDLLDLVSPVGK